MFSFRSNEYPIIIILLRKEQNQFEVSIELNDRFSLDYYSQLIRKILNTNEFIRHNELEFERGDSISNRCILFTLTLSFYFWHEIKTSSYSSIFHKQEGTAKLGKGEEIASLTSILS